eukprot:Seg2284.8 transcript_id=Seg2284.8/GoldUCD/mRNA.D3Y31 product="hypothetical protein" protein_id=Seg2284.8/GoldUCD/D3Y31
MKSFIVAILCIAICVWTQMAFFAVAEPNVRKAEEAAKAYRPGDGVKRLRSQIEEGKFGKILQWTQVSKVCLRRGTSAGGACYALGDFKVPGNMIEVLKFFTAPYTANPKVTDDWYEAFYNCVAKILIREDDDSAPVLILTGTGAADGEKYHVSKVGLGNMMTFGKTSGRNGTPAGRKLVMPVQNSLDAIVNTVNRVLAILVSAYD